MVMSFCHVPVFVFLIQQFNVGERYRCLSLGHAVGSMLFSGSTPAISTFIWYYTQMRLAPIGYFMVLVLMSITALSIGQRYTYRDRAALIPEQKKAA
jgi:hypothetical protein